MTHMTHDIWHVTRDMWHMPRDNMDKVILLNFETFWCFFGQLNAYLVVLTIYLAIIKKEKIEEIDK